MNSLRITVDGFAIDAIDGQSVIEACNAAGIYIPRLCYHPDLEPAGNCRVCTCMEDGRTVFGFVGRGITVRLNVDAEGGLGDTRMAAIDKAARICPVACIVIKRDSYRVPNGQRRFDLAPVGSDIEVKWKA
jgi:predicted molibdopterin-dependent oxidoreductase YjgC